MSAQPPDVHKAPDISVLEPTALNLLERVDHLTEVEQYLVARAGRHRIITGALWMMSLTHETISPMYWQARGELKRVKQYFTEEYDQLYPDYPLESGQAIDVARMVFDLVRADYSDFQGE